ncbi:MAG: polysaccharide biosynthesis tyrosine autokinase [Candidatus Schekmanbacteria bacterium]|nr:polysaccharide biosynthesis tyrosine autokinase [Candidatus Schekmanbacteria bacterium]
MKDLEIKENGKGLMRKDSIGRILLSFQKITEDDIEKIKALQEKDGIYFGEAAIKLGLATKEDVDLAVAYQFSHPYLNNKDNTISKEVIAAYSPFAPKVEAIRNIRTALLLQGAGIGLKSICLAGCQEESGKTFIATNLAVVFAQLGQKTLLLDFNLRKPKIHKLFKLKNSFGVSTLLANRSTLEETIQTTPFEKLDVLPSGPLPPNPTALFARKGARQLMETLRNSYEVVIVNVPSFQTAADAPYLASFMDGALIVVLKGKTRKDELEKAKKNLEAARAQVLGVVINQK